MIGLLCLALAAAPAAAKKKKGRAEDERGAAATWYAQTIGRGERGFVVTHLWSKGPLFRAETVIAGHRIVTIVNGETYYTIDEVFGKGVGIRRSPHAMEADAVRSRPFGLEREEVLRRGGEKIRRESYGGRPCDLYQVTTEAGRRQVCVSPESPHLPVHVETYHRASGKTDTVDYVGWLSGLAIPDAFFEPGSDLQIERLDYQEYVAKSRTEAVGPAPALFFHLLHGARE